MPYLPARPLLKGDDGWKEVRKFLGRRCGLVVERRQAARRGLVVATAFALAFNDAQQTGKLHPLTTGTPSTACGQGQKKTGEWNWLKCDWPPLRARRLLRRHARRRRPSAHAPDGYAKTDAAKAGIEKLRATSRKTPAPDLHHRAMLLWASTKLDGLMSAEEREADRQANCCACSGPTAAGACRRSANWKRRDEGRRTTPDAPSDGYGTGFVIYVLRQAGVPADDRADRTRRGLAEDATSARRAGGSRAR